MRRFSVDPKKLVEFIASRCWATPWVLDRALEPKYAKVPVVGIDAGALLWYISQASGIRPKVIRDWANDVVEKRKNLEDCNVQS